MLNALLKNSAPDKPQASKPTSKIDFSSVPYEGKSRSVGFSIRQSLVSRLEQIRDTHNLRSTNQVIAYALRYFVLQYEAGVSGIEHCVKEPQVAKAVLDMGDDDD